MVRGGGGGAAAVTGVTTISLGPGHGHGSAIAWGRYAELFSYDEEAEQFSLEDIG